MKRLARGGRPALGHACSSSPRPGPRPAPPAARSSTTRASPWRTPRSTIDFQGGVTRKLRRPRPTRRASSPRSACSPGSTGSPPPRKGYQGGYVDVRIGLGEATYLPDLKLVSAAAARRGGQGGAAEKANAELRAVFEGRAGYPRPASRTRPAPPSRTSWPRTSPLPEVHYNLGHAPGREEGLGGRGSVLPKALELQARATARPPAGSPTCTRSRARRRRPWR